MLAAVASVPARGFPSSHFHSSQLPDTRPPRPSSYIGHTWEAGSSPRPLRPLVWEAAGFLGLEEAPFSLSLLQGVRLWECDRAVCRLRGRRLCLLAISRRGHQIGTLQGGLGESPPLQISPWSYSKSSFSGALSLAGEKTKPTPMLSAQARTLSVATFPLHLPTAEYAWPLSGCLE